MPENQFEVYDSSFYRLEYVVKLPVLFLSAVGTLPPAVINFVTRDGTRIARWSDAKNAYALCHLDGTTAKVVKQVRKWRFVNGVLLDAKTVDNKSSSRTKKPHKTADRKLDKRRKAKSDQGGKGLANRSKGTEKSKRP